MIHHFPIRVYYEDTDMAGIVYYANYLKYIERARSDWIRKLGIDQNRMKNNDGLVFAVRRVEADYLAPAQLDDELEIETDIVSVSGARLVLSQVVKKLEKVIFTSVITIVCINEFGQPARLPDTIRLMLH